MKRVHAAYSSRRTSAARAAADAGCPAAGVYDPGQPYLREEAHTFSPHRISPVLVRA